VEGVTPPHSPSVEGVVANGTVPKLNPHVAPGHNEKHYCPWSV